MKVNEMKEPLYLTIEAVCLKDPSIEKFTFSNFDLCIPNMTWHKFKRKYGDAYVVSVRDFDDTHTTSIIFSSKDPGHDPLHSIHTEDHKIIWLDE